MSCESSSALIVTHFQTLLQSQEIDPLNQQEIETFLFYVWLFEETHINQPVITSFGVK